MFYNALMTTTPAWLFPAPVRRSRFMASSAEWKPYNIEVALDRIATWDFSGGEIEPVLHFDYQTQLDNNAPGRHGSGRGGVFRNYYVKGVGRTQAAGNWNSTGDRYHGSGHMAVASALRERLISVALTAQGLGDAIVPCESILLAKLRPDERRAVAIGASSSQASFTPADEKLMALSVKRADFARMSNIVWALDHHCTDPQAFGTLFLDFERFLNPPGEREGLEGAPDTIALAMDRAFQRGLANFGRFNRVGAFWIYLQNNFTLDGRMVDLETPLYFGAPFAGVFEQAGSEPGTTAYLGFESFAYVYYWRLFVDWLKHKLRYLTSRGLQDMREKQAFLKALLHEVSAVFSLKHLLYDDDRLKQMAVDELAECLDLGRAARAGLRSYSDAYFPGVTAARAWKLPDLQWKELATVPAPISAVPFAVRTPGFSNAGVSEAGAAYAAALQRLGNIQDAGQLLDALSKHQA